MGSRKALVGMWCWMCKAAWVDEDARVGLDKYTRGYLTKTTDKRDCDTSEGGIGARTVSGSQRYLC